MAHRKGFEPPTLGSEDRCSNPLSYRCKTAESPVDSNTYQAEIVSVNKLSVIIIQAMKFLDGRELAGFVEVRQTKAVRSLKQAHRIVPGLAIITTTEDPLIDSYIRLKQKYAARIGAKLDLHRVSQSEVVHLLKQLNSDPQSHGIVIQLPLADISQTDKLCQLISPAKDVDGLNPASSYDSATATAINWLLAGHGINLVGKKIVIIGKGRLVGEPLTDIWQKSKLEVQAMDKDDLSWQVVREAEVVIAATGQAGLVTSEHLADGAVVIDAGTTVEKGQISGDISPDVYEQRHDLIIAPKQGGVGPLTVAVLFENLIAAARTTLTSSS